MSTAGLRKAQARSAITNGQAIVAGIDGRSTWCRRLRDLVQLHLSDMGGESNCSEAEKSLIRRAAVLSVELERMEAAFAVDEADPAALDAYQRASNSLRRLLESLGLQRRARPVPNLAQYIEATYGGDDKGKAKAKAQDLEAMDV